MKKIGWNIKGKVIELLHPVVMGVLNVTPDSFSDGGKFYSEKNALVHARKMFDQGANIIDVGGESTRPGAIPVDPSEEIGRIVPIIKKLSSDFSIPISVDTRKAVVARAALDAGASIVNDISALGDSEMAKVVCEYNAGIVLMHIHGEPQTMQENPLDEKVVVEKVKSDLQNRINFAILSGIEKDKIVIDPGIGFGKTFKANQVLLKNLAKLLDLKFPILIGASKKKFIGEIIEESSENRSAGSIAAHIIAFQNGASIIRTHDVKETKDALMVVENILETEKAAFSGK